MLSPSLGLGKSQTQNQIHKSIPVENLQMQNVDNKTFLPLAVRFKLEIAKLGLLHRFFSVLNISNETDPFSMNKRMQ